MIRERMITLLAERGWSLKQFSEICGVPYDTLKNIHMGKTTDPKLSTAADIAAAFGISINCLMGKCAHTSQEKMLLRNYRECGKHGRSIIELVAKFEAGAIKNERNTAGKHPIPCVQPNGDMHKGILWDTAKTEDAYTSNPNAYIGIKMPNDDFSPLYCENDIVLFEDRIPHNGEIAALLFGDRAYIRKVIKETNGYVLKCLHNYGENINIKRMDEISIIGTVTGVIRS